MTWRSYLHVIIQFTSIFFVFFTGPVLFISPLSFPIIAGIILGIWSIFVMRNSVLSVMPDPQADIKLITRGPYKLIRHPMYSALFLVLIPLVINYTTKERIIVIVLFTINQILKLLYEEKLIIKKLPDYYNYMQKTWRLIPYLY